MLGGASGGLLLLDDALLEDNILDISREREAESSSWSKASERKLRIVPIEVVDIRRDLRFASASSTSSVRWTACRGGVLACARDEVTASRNGNGVRLRT